MSVPEYQTFSVMTICYSVALIGFFGGEFFHSAPYVGICVAACLWSVMVVRQLKAVGAPASSWGARPARAVLTPPSPRA